MDAIKEPENYQLKSHKLGEILLAWNNLKSNLSIHLKYLKFISLILYEQYINQCSINKFCKSRLVPLNPF